MQMRSVGSSKAESPSVSPTLTPTLTPQMTPKSMKGHDVQLDVGFSPLMTPEKSAKLTQSSLEPKSASKKSGKMSQNVAGAIKTVTKMTTATPGAPATRKRPYLIVLILFIINLLNYMDRFTVAAVLHKLQMYFGIGDTSSGTLQTVFICAYMIFAPVCGYLGDRYSRKLIMIIGIFIWCSTVLLSSFVKTDQFGLFMFTRAVVGIGEASYSTVSPAIIADLYTDEQRSRNLMIFYFAIPVGSGLGYVIGGEIAEATGQWQWGVRVTPALGAICLILLICFVEDPKRGQADLGNIGAETTEKSIESKKWHHDLFYLAKNKSFIYSTLGFVCVSFTAGALSLWAPMFITQSQLMQNKTEAGISLVFGGVTCMSGFIGVAAGSLSAAVWRRTNPKADPLICAIGMFICLPFYLAVLHTVEHSLIIGYLLTFVAITGLSVNWAVVSDILMYIVIPSVRSSANALQILFAHLLGDAFSPMLVGLISDSLKPSENYTHAEHFKALKYSMHLPALVVLLGCLFFFINAWYVVADKQSASSATKSLTTGSRTPPYEITGSQSPNVSKAGPGSSSNVQNKKT